jgi:hypothetical protein
MMHFALVLVRLPMLHSGSAAAREGEVLNLVVNRCGLIVVLEASIPILTFPPIAAYKLRGLVFWETGATPVRPPPL